MFEINYESSLDVLGGALLQLWEAVALSNKEKVISQQYSPDGPYHGVKMKAYLNVCLLHSVQWPVLIIFNPTACVCLYVCWAHIIVAL